MTNKIVKIKDWRSRGGYSYRFDYESMRTLFKFLSGVVLVSAAPLFYGVVTNDFILPSVFMANAAAGALAGAANFFGDDSNDPPHCIPMTHFPRLPSVARRGLKNVA